MALPVTIPNTFANATAAIPLSQLDANFNTLSNAVNGLNSGSETLANLKATTANVVTLTVTGNATIGDASTDTVTLNSTLTANTAVIFSAGTSAAPSITFTSDTNTGIFSPAADTIAFAEGGAEAMRIDSSGNLGVGVSSPLSRIDARAASAVIANYQTIQAFSTDSAAINLGGGIGLGGYYSGTASVAIFGNVTGRKENATDGNFSGYLAFGTNNNSTGIVERARIDSSGNLLVGTTSPSFSEKFNATQSADFKAGLFFNTNASFTNYVINLRASRNTTNNTYGFLQCSRDGVADALFIADSGNVTNANNSYGAISDVKLKQDIVDAGSQWDDIKNLRVRKYHWKSDPNGFMQMGLVAQEAELVSPGLIDEHPDYEEVEVTDEEGNVTKERQLTGTTTKAIKYSVLYMKAVKALQEAQLRIEALEARLAALEAK
jgi:uncharacterized protein GlcG (DUF336 family)